MILPSPSTLKPQSFGKAMQAGEGGLSWWVRRQRLAQFGLGLLFCVLAGCATSSQHLEQALMSDQPQPAHREELAEHYLIGCPDVIATTVAGRSVLSGSHRVAADGRIDLSKLGRVRVEGRTVSEAAALIAARAAVPPSSVRVRVVEFKSQQIYLVGEVHGLQRAVPYVGPERVAELLQRVGGIAPGAAVGEIHVIRSHISEGRTPEVFQVNLQAIVMNHDQRTNLVLQAFDQIHIGETRRSTLSRSLPPVLLPFYQSIFGLQPGPDKETGRSGDGETRRH